MIYTFLSKKVTQLKINILSQIDIYIVSFFLKKYNLHTPVCTNSYNLN